MEGILSSRSTTVLNHQIDFHIYLDIFASSEKKKKKFFMAGSVAGQIQGDDRRAVGRFLSGDIVPSDFGPNTACLYYTSLYSLGSEFSLLFLWDLIDI